ncbi:hypothetical protein [Natrinema soli]|uniref:BZIP transcription factor n=1 Tax=Natrinema soli TaxID=1930624 RepID=A0ABD5SLT4_9EURY|nr:hypothetical protein [Natrinema soli]
MDIFPDNRSTRDYDPTTDRFTADGGLEPTEESVATSLEDFGADVSHRKVEHDSITRASEFGIDDRVDELEATLGEKDDRINELEATNEALREQLSDYQEVLERRDQYLNLE